MSEKTKHLLFVIFLFISSFATAQKAEDKIKVMVWLSTECPLSQKYTSNLNQIYEKHGQKVDLLAVYPGEKSAAIRRFRKDYRFKWRTLKDRNKKITRKYAASITPEVLVLGIEAKVAYRGAIDNQVVALGKFKDQADEHYLADAIEALLNHRTIKITETKPIGCIID